MERGITREVSIDGDSLSAATRTNTHFVASLAKKIPAAYFIANACAILLNHHQPTLPTSNPL